jgi:hypothetical protein
MLIKEGMRTPNALVKVTYITSVTFAFTAGVRSSPMVPSRCRDWVTWLVASVGRKRRQARPDDTSKL